MTIIPKPRRTFTRKFLGRIEMGEYPIKEFMDHLENALKDASNREKVIVIYDHDYEDFIEIREEVEEDDESYNKRIEKWAKQEKQAQDQAKEKKKRDAEKERALYLKLKAKYEGESEK